FGVSGFGGSAQSNLTLSDHQAGRLSANVIAHGGNGGNAMRGWAYDGAQGNASLVLASTVLNAAVHASTEARGGDGGSEQISWGSSSGGGGATASTTASGSGPVTALADARGGNGGAGGSGGYADSAAPASASNGQHA